jgi:hypothetical protein
MVYLRPLVHYGLHFIFPGFIACKYYPESKLRVYLLLIASMLIDLDHLLASPVFDACRCSIGFHPLHSWYAFAVYIVLLYFPKTRIIAIGLVLHLVTDFIDCLLNVTYK